jgi:hypothetical protein
VISHHLLLLLQLIDLGHHLISLGSIATVGIRVELGGRGADWASGWASGWALRSGHALVALWPWLARWPRRSRHALALLHPAHLTHNLLQVSPRHPRAHGGLLQIILLLHSRDPPHILLGHIGFNLVSHLLEERTPRQPQGRVIKRESGTFHLRELSSLREGDLATKASRSLQGLHL